MITSVFPLVLAIASFSLPEKWKSKAEREGVPLTDISSEEEVLVRRKKVKIEKPKEESNL